MTSSTPLEAATHIARTLQEAGHVAYFAGGCVRDTLLGLTPKDYDVATDAPPDRVAALFPRTQFVGEAFGVTLVRHHGQAIEVATFRKEWGYTDGRRPTQIQFTDAQQDALRRDFTINGLFQNPLVTSPDQAIIDYVGGVADLKAGVLRAIGNADDRFAEDYLRMLRAVRFAARYHFTIDEHTQRAIRLHARYLGQISRERIGQELQMMLTPGSDPVRHGPRPIAIAAYLLTHLRLDGPSLNEPHHECPLPTLDALSQNSSPDADYAAALLAWMIDRRQPSPSVASMLDWLTSFATGEAGTHLQRWRKALVLANAVYEAMSGSLSLMAQACGWSDRSVAHRKRLLAQPHWARARALLHALSHQHDVKALITQIDQDTPALAATGLAPQPLVTGEDLINLGQKPGPSFRRSLDHAYDMQLEGQFTTREAALNWLKDYLTTGQDNRP